MSKLKKNLMLFGFILTINLFISILYLFTNISYNIISSILIIINIIFLSIISFNIAKRSKQKGIFIGLELGIITSIVFLLLALIFKYEIKINSLLYYIIIILSSMLAAIFSKNIKK